MKIEALTDRLNAEIRGKVPKEEKLRAAISETVQKAGTAALASGDAGDPTWRHAVLLAMGCQMLWNAFEDARAKIAELEAAGAKTPDASALPGENKESLPA